jgi:hypothetical protein
LYCREQLQTSQAFSSKRRVTNHDIKLAGGIAETWMIQQPIALMKLDSRMFAS